MADTTTATPRQRKAKHTYMLHDPTCMSSLGKFVSTDYRYAALKVASRGHTDIVLRKTNTRECRQYKGEVVTLDEPKEIRRGERTITYHKKPRVTFVRKWVYAGPAVSDDPEETTTGL